jgi:hypothetical protein
MAALSVTTIILSLTEGCPGLPFYILEVIINTSMILEVSVRFVAFGKVRDLFLERLGLSSRYLAILEISFQRGGPYFNSILRFDAAGIDIR